MVRVERIVFFLFFIELYIVVLCIAWLRVLNTVEGYIDREYKIFSLKLFSCGANIFDIFRDLLRFLPPEFGGSLNYELGTSKGKMQKNNSKQLNFRMFLFKFTLVTHLEIEQVFKFRGEKHFKRSFSCKWDKKSIFFFHHYSIAYAFRNTHVKFHAFFSKSCFSNWPAR